MSNNKQCVDLESAVKLMWFGIGLSTAVPLIEKFTGVIGAGALFFMLAMCGLMCIFPYKILNGSNAFRYVFVVINVVSLLWGLATFGEMGETVLQKIVFLISIPMFAYTAKLLFSKQANEFFKK